MRTILLTPQIYEMADNYAKTLFVGRTKKFERPLPRLKEFLNELSKIQNLHTDYKRYVRMIIRLYPILNNLPPSNYRKVHLNGFNDFKIDLSKAIIIKGDKLPFYKHITEAMRYEKAREKEFLFYAKKLGIRACVYCNISYALSPEVDNHTVGRYELDHAQAQSAYPYLCTNFFNLYPVCSNCNKSKLHNPAEFSLYTELPKQQYPFKFELDKKSIIRYMLSQDFNDLEITFRSSLYPGHDRMFKITPSYNVLKDVVEELVWKYKVYNPAYLKSLHDAFNRKFSYDGIGRFILGNYDEARDIHKRPLSKLSQDIARQLGIIK